MSWDYLLYLFTPTLYPHEAPLILCGILAAVGMFQCHIRATIYNLQLTIVFQDLNDINKFIMHQVIGEPEEKRTGTQS